MAMTLAQKILARASGKNEVKQGDYVIADIDLAMAHDGLGAVIRILNQAGIKKLWDPDRVVSLLDHSTPAPTVQAAEGHKMIQNAVKDFKIENFYGQRAGICHQVLPEKGFVLPGQLIVGTDSHTTTYGAFGAAGTGIGFSEMAYVMATGKLWFMVPETIRFVLSGNLPSGVMSKDIMLYIAGKYSVTVAQYKAVEFAGPVAREMSLASRMTMSNMSVEIGAKFGFFTPDEKVTQYLSTRTDREFALVSPDEDAVYQKEYQVDVSGLEPQIAVPYAIDNVKPVSELAGTKLDQAVLGGCTNGRLEDLRAAAEILKGRKVHPDTRMLVVPASAEVYQEAITEGIMYSLVDSGAVILNSSCGICFGSHMGLLASGENCIASINRNFKGRMGSPDARVYLASPATVAASAVAGVIADPRKY